MVNGAVWIGGTERKRQVAGGEGEKKFGERKWKRMGDKDMRGEKKTRRSRHSLMVSGLTTDKDVSVKRRLEESRSSNGF